MFNCKHKTYKLISLIKLSFTLLMRCVYFTQKLPTNTLVGNVDRNLILIYGQTINITGEQREQRLYICLFFQYR